VAIFWGIALPTLGALGAAWFLDPATVEGGLSGAAVHMPGVRAQTPLALLVLGCMLALHIMGLIDDRRPMGPWVKTGDHGDARCGGGPVVS
jgi:hypothetical protein